MRYEKIILGAGPYGLYAATLCGRRGEHVLVLECDDEPFKRATYINQARVHMGYHYPRSYSTAIKSAGYFNRFVEEFGFCIHSTFQQVYATSAQNSWTNAEQFLAFCRAANIRCDPIDPKQYFRANLCDGAFITQEYTYDAHILRDHFLTEIAKLPNITLRCSVRVQAIMRTTSCYRVAGTNGTTDEAPFVLNATYAGSNQILDLLFKGCPDMFSKEKHPYFAMKYELCEIILCDVDDVLRDVGLTVMDGPFFSIMPFGRTGLHSLTAVSFTPHKVSYELLPTFPCQANNSQGCSPRRLNNCNDCPYRPESAWYYMASLARKYMREKFAFRHKCSLYSVKPILKAAEIDDSRPTVIRKLSEAPTFISVLSGKINTVYDLDEVL